MNARLIPTLPAKCTLRVEAEGGIYLSGSGFYKAISKIDLELLREIDGVENAYSIAKDLSKSEADLACLLIRISGMVDEGIISLQQVPFPSPQKAFIAKNPPFSNKAFSSPVMVSLAVTERCNRKCIHCYRKGIDRLNSLDLDGFYALIESLAKLDIAILNITGGEPFLYEHIVDLAAFAADRINGVTISTNGTLLNRSLVTSLAGSSVKALQIGLNAVYDTSTGFDIESSEKVFESARIANEEGIRVVFGVVLTINTNRRLEEIFRHSSESRVSSIRLGPLLNVHPGCAQLRINPEEVLDASMNASKLAREYGISVQFVDGLADPGESQASLDERKHYCYLGTGILHIEPDGSLFPCSALISDEFCIGQASCTTTVEELISIWRESRILEYLREVTIDSLESCRSCGIRSRCGGGCRTAAYWNTGSIKGENPFCQIAKGCQNH